MRKAQKKPRGTASPTDPSPYPKGWNRKRVQALIDYYENQPDDQAIAEAEAAYNAVGSTMMQIPIALVPQVEKLLRKAG